MASASSRSRCVREAARVPSSGTATAKRTDLQSIKVDFVYQQSRVYENRLLRGACQTRSRGRCCIANVGASLVVGRRIRPQKNEGQAWLASRRVRNSGP